MTNGRESLSTIIKIILNKKIGTSNGDESIHDVFASDSYK